MGEEERERKEGSLLGAPEGETEAAGGDRLLSSKSWRGLGCRDLLAAFGLLLRLLPEARAEGPGKG